MGDPHSDLLPLREATYSFEVVRKGYDRDQVAEAIERLDADLRVTMADRDAAAQRSSELASQLNALQSEMEGLRRKAASAGAPTFENMG